MMISHVKIIAFRATTNHSFWTFYIGGKSVVYIINRKIQRCLEIPDLFLVLDMISCSTLEINLVFPRTHVLFSMYFICCIEGVHTLVLVFEMLYASTSPRDSLGISSSTFSISAFPLKPLCLQKILFWFNNIDMLMTFPGISKICFIIFTGTSVGVCDCTISFSAFIHLKCLVFHLKLLKIYN